MNRQQRRLNEKYAKKQIKIKKVGVNREMIKAFSNLSKIIYDKYGDQGIPEEELKLLIDKKSQDTELQEVFNKYSEVKRAQIVLELMKKELKNGNSIDSGDGNLPVIPAN